MLELRIGGVPCRFSLLFPAMVAVAVTLDPSVFSLWCLAASFMHEAGHFTALLAFDCKPQRISVGLFGMRVEQDPAKRLGYRQNALVSLAGPAVNLVTFCILSFFHGNEAAALVHLTLGVFNLLPIEPLDGGQALYCLLALRMEEESARKWVLRISVITLFPIAAAGFFVLAMSGYNITLLAVSLYLSLLLLLKEKA